MKELDPTVSFLDRARMGHLASRREIREFARTQSKVLDDLELKVSIEGNVPKQARIGLIAKASLGAVQRVGEEMLRQSLALQKKKDNKRFSLLFDFSAGIQFICADLVAARTIGVFPGRQFLLKGITDFIRPDKRGSSQGLVRETTEETMQELIDTKKLLDRDPTGFTAIDETLRRLVSQGSSWALSAQLVNTGAVSAVKLYKRVYQETTAQFSS